MRRVLLVIVLILLVVVSFVLLMGVFLGIGWLLTLFLPLTLFEGALLSMLAGISLLVFWRNVARSVPPAELAEEDEFEELPMSRFGPTEEERTWGNWFRYVLANGIYVALLDSADWPAVDEEELQEMSIRLADAGLAALRRISPQTKRLKVSRGTLRHELSKTGESPLDEAVLTVAAAAVNEELIYIEGALRGVMRDGLWEKPADVVW